MLAGLRKHPRFDSAVQAIGDFAEKAAPMMDRTNREYFARLIAYPEGNDVWYTYTKIRMGFHTNVIFWAVLGALARPFFKHIIEYSAIHTHTNCTCHIPDEFSGDPAHPLRRPGDVTATEVLGYDAIYLVTPDGKLYRYAGAEKGTAEHGASTRKELVALKEKPLARGLECARVRFGFGGKKHIINR